MNKSSSYLSKGFLRTFALAGAWTVFGAGVYLFAGNPSLAAGILMLTGSALAVVAFTGRSLKDGEYPRGSLFTMALTAIGLLFFGLFLRVFAKGTVVLVWAVYFAGIVVLLIASAFQLSKSARPDHQ